MYAFISTRTFPAARLITNISFYLPITFCKAFTKSSQFIAFRQIQDNRFSPH